MSTFLLAGPRRRRRHLAVWSPRSSDGSWTPLCSTLRGAYRTTGPWSPDWPTTRQWPVCPACRVVLRELITTNLLEESCAT